MRGVVPRRRASPPTRDRQSGAISVLAVMLIALVGMAALVSIDVGHVFYRQRQLQNMADLAALSGAQQLKAAGSNTAQGANVLAAAQGVASQNGYSSGVSTGCATATGGAADAMRVCLGVWDPQYAGAKHFDAAYDATRLSPNAVRVEATQTVPILFVLSGGQARQLHAEAIASGSAPVAAFSLGSGLLNVNTASGALGFLLGNTVQLSAVDWQGLVDTTVTLDQLRLRLGVGTIDQLLRTSLSIQQFYALVLGAAGKDSLLSAALGTPATTLGVSGTSANMTLGQMLNLGVLAPAASSAAEVGLNVASLLMLGAQVANGQSALAVGLSPISVPGIASVSANVYVGQPPVMAVGPARQVSSSPVTWQTSARTAQLGLNAIVQATPVNLPPLSEVRISLPVHLSAVQATADLTALQCAAAASDRRATLNVNTRIAAACLANATGSDCASGPVTIGSAKALGLNIVELKATLLPSSATSGTSVTLAAGQHAQVGSSQVLANTVNDLLMNLQITTVILGVPLDLPAGWLLGTLLTPVTQALDLVVNRLTNTLGIQLGTADLWMHNIDCNNAELVF